MHKAYDAKGQYKQAGIEVGQGKYHEEIVYGLALMYSAIYKEVSSYLKKFDLTPDEMNVLMIIKHQGKEQGLSQVDLGRRLLVNAHNMTRLIQRLEKDALISRKIYQEDARVNLVKVTVKGSKLLDAIWPGYDQIVQQLAGKLPNHEQKIFAQLVHKWLGRGE